MATAANVPIEEVHRHSLDSYHRFIETGAFDDDDHVELLHGLIVEMSPKSPAHERAMRWLTRWLVTNVDHATHEVGVHSPLTLADTGSEPEPDFIVFERETPTPYHPATAALVVEVSASSLRRDLGVKAALYATAGVLEYWVVDLGGGRIVVHRDPRDATYEVREERSAGDRLLATAVALPALDVGEVLRAAGG